MISFRECAAFCGLDEGQIAAVAAHEHVPATEASAIVSHLLGQPGGAGEIRSVLPDLIRDAVRQRRFAHAAKLLNAFQLFLNCDGFGEAA
jgi:hypothetical protein